MIRKYHYQTIIRSTAEALTYGISLNFTQEQTDQFLDQAIPLIMGIYKVSHDEVLAEVLLEMVSVAEQWNDNEQEFREFCRVKFGKQKGLMM